MAGELIRQDLLMIRIDEMLKGHEWKDDGALLRFLRWGIVEGYFGMCPC